MSYAHQQVNKNTFKILFPCVLCVPAVYLHWRNISTLAFIIA
jgi:hypothetical protein